MVRKKKKKPLSMDANDWGLNFIVKLTKHCNFCCSYCYEHPTPLNESSNLEFDSQKITLLFQRIRKGLDACCTNRNLKLNFIWHGGEPFLYKPTFFRELLSASDDTFFYSPYKIQHSFQTNGAIPLDNYIPILVRWGVGVGFSYDYGSHFRRNAKGSNASRQIFRNMRLLEKYNRPRNALCVVSKQNVNKVRGMYNFFKKRNTSFGTLQMLADIPELLPLVVSPRGYGQFIIDMTELWLNDTDDKQIVFFNARRFIHNILKHDGLGICWQSPKCALNHFTIHTDGNVNSCDCDLGQSNVSGYFGNIYKDPFYKIISHPTRLKMIDRWKTIKKNRKNCKWLDLCWGGCPMQNFEGDYFKCSDMCQTIQMVYTYLNKRRDLIRKKLARLKKCGLVDWK